MTPRTPTVAVYCRISKDSNGDGVGVARQEADCREYADRNGMHIADVFIENNTSAFAKHRPLFEQMIANIDRYDALLVYKVDRLYRRLRDLEGLIDVLGSKPVYAVASSDVNLATPNGRTVARVMGSIAQGEVEELAGRVRDAARHRAESGRATTGRRPFGWQRVGHGLEPEPREAAAVATAYSMLLDGYSLSAIARWMNAEGFEGTRGGQWTQSRVSALLRQPRHGGLVVYQGEVRNVDNAEGHIVTKTQWRQAQRILTAPGRKVKGPDAKTMLTGIMACYKCGGTVRPSSNQSRAGVRYKTYACVSNHVSWRRETLDTVVDETVVAYLDRNIDVLRAARDQALIAMTGEASADHMAHLERLRDDRGELAKAYADGDLSLDAFKSASKELDQRIEDAESNQSPATPPAVTALLSTDDIAAAWRGTDLVGRRAVLAELLDHITVFPARTGQVEFTWRSA